jgi:hypothetical protein
MKTVIAILLFATSVPFAAAQVVYEDPVQQMMRGMIEGQRLRIERERARAAADLMRAQTEAIRADTERVRLQEQPKQATGQQTPNQPDSPVVALVRDPDFHRLPMALRIKFVKLVDPAFAKFTNDDLETVIGGLGLKVLAAEAEASKTPK